MCEDILAFGALLPAKRAASQTTNLLARKVGKRSLTAADVLDTQKRFKEKMRMMGGGGDRAKAAVLSYLDKDGSGSVTRDEIMMLAVTWDILKHKDKKTGMVRRIGVGSIQQHPASDLA